MSNYDEMCPNCVTPWKCNGPHLLVEEDTPEIAGAKQRLEMQATQLPNWARQLLDYISTLERECSELRGECQSMAIAKRYEPINTYDGLDIKQWKARAEAAEARATAAEFRAASLTYIIQQIRDSTHKSAIMLRAFAQQALEQ